MFPELAKLSLNWGQFGLKTLFLVGIYNIKKNNVFSPN